MTMLPQPLDQIMTSQQFSVTLNAEIVDEIVDIVPNNKTLSKRVQAIAQQGSFSTSFTIPSLGSLPPEKFFFQLLPFILKNDAKHEYCIDILDQYEQVLGEVYMKAFDVGLFALLEEAKHLRSLATSPEKRFEDLHPFMIELWHIKQEFFEVLINPCKSYKGLMKCFKELFSSKNLRQTGTLYHYKCTEMVK
ncbi:hypothetical protein DPMN_067878 [Dreissena polymorpha]|uniref:Uncharacterized protein n=1 Tax=Dreissena polymorpha TaxID=45954 RepID=A0A9D3YW27_DREPO|nr:hypothetical protein DPMN_067878 [Dreissena polymorpha]